TIDEAFRCYVSGTFSWDGARSLLLIAIDPTAAEGPAKMKKALDHDGLRHLLAPFAYLWGHRFLNYYKNYQAAEEFFQLAEQRAPANSRLHTLAREQLKGLKREHR